MITPQKNLWHCLGACQQGGSVIDWVMKSRSVSFRHAVEILRARRTAGTPRPRSRCSAGASDAERRRLRAALPGRRLLPRDAQAEPGGARLPRETRPPVGRGDRALQARLREPHARLSAAASPKAAGAPGAARHRPATAGTSTSTARWWSRSWTSTAVVLGMYGRKIGPDASSGRGRRFTSTCQVRTAASSTWRH